MGCYEDGFSIINSRDLSEKRVEMGPGASLQLCQRLCQGYRYVGLQADDLCFCGRSFGK